MVEPNEAPTDAPPAHVGKHYQNPSTKPLRGRLGALEREEVQRIVWPALLALILCLVAAGEVVGLLGRAR